MARSTVSLLLLVALFALLGPVSSAQQEDDAKPVSVVPAGEDAFIPPQIVLGTQEQPEFPPAAWEARFTGAVLLEMTVLKDGTVGKVEVIRCTRPKVGFEEAAIAAVKQWQFEPGMEGGEPIEVKTRLKLNFTRVGVGVRAQPQVSAGSFTHESTEGGSKRSMARPSGGDRK